MEKVNELVKEIRENLSQKGSSQRDETRVMRAMLNDKEYEVGIYNKNGLQGTICPAKEARELISSVISSTTKIPAAEAESLANDYEFKKSEANNMINISKEFIDTYVETGRKLPLGGREKSDVSLCQKNVPETIRTYPKRVGVKEDGTPIIENGEVLVKAHDSMRVIAPCPEWIKNSK